ncbi:uncharacterized protein ISCGN_016119 [Ixodes scapularis]
MATDEATPLDITVVRTLRLPRFWTADPQLWFAQVESQFTTSHITSQAQRFHHVVAALPPETAVDIRDIILEPPTTNPYDNLKAELIKRTSASEHQRLQRLLTSEELGDRTPSQLLRRLQQLLGERAATFDPALLRELFLQRLPNNATEEKKLRHLMRGVKSEIFGGLTRNPPTTVDGPLPIATTFSVPSATTPPREPVSLASPGKLGAATPGGDVAENDGSKQPPRTPERSHSPDAPHRTDAPATVSNNLNVVIDGHDASALVDTGADYSVLSGRLSRRLRKVTTPWDGPQIRTAGGHLITPVGRCTARVEIHGETCPVKFVILQDCSRDVILGMDFLCEYGAVIDLGENRLTLRKPVPPSEKPQSASAAVRVAADHVNLPPRSSVFVPVVTDAATCGEVLLEGNLQLLLGRGIGVARGVAELQDGRTVVLVTNFRKKRNTSQKVQPWATSRNSETPPKSPRLLKNPRHLSKTVRRQRSSTLTLSFRPETTAAE